MARLAARDTVHTMPLESCDSAVFIGLKTAWRGSRLYVSPVFPDPYGAFVYNAIDSLPLKPWRSSAPESQKRATVRATLCRAWRSSNSDHQRHEALFEGLLMFTLRDFCFLCLS